MNPVLDAIRPVVERARWVRFAPEAAARYADAQAAAAACPPAWTGDGHFFDGGERTLAYLLVLDALNFCFWGAPRWRVRDSGNGRDSGRLLDGYAALAVRLREAFAGRHPAGGARLDDPATLADLPRASAAELLAGEDGVEIPLFEERWRILQEVGRGLTAFEGHPARLVEAAGGSALRLTALLVEHFPSFRDEADYRGRRVFFYKRAQIFCADVHGAFGGRGWGAFGDLDSLTAFADYKLPQLLRARGILRYAPPLAEQVDAQHELPAGGEAEVEIRAHTVHAVERLKGLLAERGVNTTSVALDWQLWHASQGLRARPYHRTRTVYY